jgi:hypothetical protein
MREDRSLGSLGRPSGQVEIPDHRPHRLLKRGELGGTARFRSRRGGGQHLHLHLRHVYCIPEYRTVRAIFSRVKKHG